MIHVEPAIEPRGFDADVRQPGMWAIAEMVGKQPDPPRAGGRAFVQRRREGTGAGGALITREEDLPPGEFPTDWREALDDLMAAYDEVCCYCCFRIHPVTGGRSVDHFVPKSVDWQLVYEWSNYRLASSRMNSRKGESEDVLDPFKVEDGWFQLELVGFQVVPAIGLEAAVERGVLGTIERLQLNGSSLREAREGDAGRYWSGELPLRLLRIESPFVARELERHGRLRPEEA